MEILDKYSRKQALYSRCFRELATNCQTTVLLFVINPAIIHFHNYYSYIPLGYFICLVILANLLNIRVCQDPNMFDSEVWVPEIRPERAASKFQK